MRHGVCKSFQDAGHHNCILYLALHIRFQTLKRNTVTVSDLLRPEIEIANHKFPEIEKQNPVLQS